MLRKYSYCINQRVCLLHHTLCKQYSNYLFLSISLNVYLQLNEPCWRNNGTSAVFCRNQAHHVYPAQPGMPMSRHYVSAVTSRHHRECPSYPTDSGWTICTASLSGGHLGMLREVAAPGHLVASSATGRKLHPEHNKIESLLKKQSNTVYSGKPRTDRVPLLLGQAHRGGTSMNSRQYKR